MRETYCEWQQPKNKHLDVTPHRALSRWGQARPDFNARLKLIWSHLITLGTVCSLFVSKHLGRSSLVINFYWQISTCYLRDQSAVWVLEFTDSASRTRVLVFFNTARILRDSSLQNQNDILALTCSAVSPLGLWSAQKKKIIINSKSQRQCFFPGCERFHVGTIFFIYHSAEGSVYLLVDERLAYKITKMANVTDVRQVISKLLCKCACS